ncbi:McrB family protein [Amycolatopsis sp. WQ 127309]|uniref:McrB family protein n=1 Tax=Amycolatopsis sp. WQ 127309 TaxID=2932773 RepID=UPI001FF35053|nr:AAA family ATPase [Amycolatopsis sp. WQ 127309]UOZ08781.1 AAA family ATPase [Amycolatopsis sp. WQ 127309]
MADSAQLLRVCMEVIRDSDNPLTQEEVVARVIGEVVAEPIAGLVQPEIGAQIGKYTAEAASIGWLSRTNGWSLTESGELALDAFPGGRLLDEFKLRTNEFRMQRDLALADLPGTERTIAQLVDVVTPGFWTSSDELGKAAGTSAEEVDSYLVDAGPAGAHRVLRFDGSVPSNDRLHPRFHGTDLQRKLATEGVTFDSTGNASERQHLDAASLRERLHWEQEARDSAPRRAWLVRTATTAENGLVTRWRAEGFVSMPAEGLRSLVLPITPDQLRSVVDDDFQHESYNARDVRFEELNGFLNRMRTGDYVITLNNRFAYFGRIASSPSFLADDRVAPLRRFARWEPLVPAPTLDQLPRSLQAKLRSTSSVVDLTENLGEIEQVLRDFNAESAEPSAEPHVELAFPEIAEGAGRDLLIGDDWLRRQTELLWEYKQLIFHGPPGTGKTYLAQKLARLLADVNAVKLVQFHPSYTYEDFFEGFRPTQNKDGKVEFGLHPGPFRTLVDAARKKPGEPHILIIDEINRANLAKVFGELYFLLEYRDEPINLLYSADAGFTLPENIFVIGTMNTTDRSIATVDAAIRRRFVFTELHPAVPPTAGLLRRWLDEHVAAEPESTFNNDAPEVLEALNEEVGRRDLALGPSFLMQPSIYRRSDGLARVWDASILPLLAENHYAAGPEALDRYSLDTIRQTLADRRT